MGGGALQTASDVVDHPAIVPAPPQGPAPCIPGRGTAPDLTAIRVGAAAPGWRRGRLPPAGPAYTARVPPRPAALPRPRRSGGPKPSEPPIQTGPSWPSLVDLVGHGEAIARLRAAMDVERLGHALLITGPDRVGKTALAVGLAGELLDRSSWPAGLATHPDLWIEDSGEEAIRIDRLRAGREPGSLQEFLSLRPYSGGRRVAVLARAERMTEQAANSLLKTVEEPPPGSHLLISARTAEALPATIVSRCQRVALGAVPTALIETWLRERHGVDAGTAVEVSELSAGRPGRALQLALEPASRESELRVLDRFLGIGGDPSGALAAAGELAPSAGAEGRERLLLNLSIWASSVRDAAALCAGAPELARWQSRLPALQSWATSMNAARAGAILDALLAAVPAVVANAHPRLVLEALFLEIFRCR
jgi:DNA polymerase-3 subunit delta'